MIKQTKKLKSFNRKQKYFLATKAIIGLVLIALLLVTGCVTQPSRNVTKEDPIQIGIITDLTGLAAYWGSSTRLGAELAVKELREQGYDVELVIEDFRFETKNALSAAQKLVTVDKVDALYVEFVTGVYPVSSYMKDKDLVVIYASPAEDVIDGSKYSLKSYLDYRAGCELLANQFKAGGIERIGMLKANTVAGELCLEGIKKLYPEVYVEPYDLGEKDFSTRLLKMDEKEIEAVINIAFEQDSLNTLKVMKEQNLHMKYGTVEDGISREVLEKYPEQIKGGYHFGFKPVSKDFIAQIDSMSGGELGLYTGAAMSYIHVKQLTKAVQTCNRNPDCIMDQMGSSEPEPIVGFESFKDRKAVFDIDMVPH